ncbi:hypothetical protein DXQ21_00170 [Listeria monocytogenes]|nr:hypothetical protein [Listeria monocytogenes]
MINPGDRVEVQDRTGVTDLCVDGEQLFVIGNINGLLTVEDSDGFSSFNIPSSQVKKVKEDRIDILMSELYERATNVEFILHRTDFSNAISFVSIVGEPKYDENDGARWFTAENGKIKAVAFLKGDN